jgi:prepilin-type processing-associated H-X9-DG protein
VKNEGVFTCPSDKGDRRTYTNFDRISVSSANFGSYAINETYVNAGDAFSAPTGNVTKYMIKLSSIVAPATAIWVMDNNGQNYPKNNLAVFWYTAQNGQDVTLNTSVSPMQMLDYNGNPFTEARHLESVSVLYIDGHVKSQKLEKLNERKVIGGKEILTAFTVEDD